MVIHRGTGLSLPTLLASVLLLSATISAQTASTNALLNGQYAFSVSGYDSENQAYAQVGFFVADGNGNITGGSGFSNSLRSGVLQTSVTGGTYRVVSDFRGTMTLNSAAGPATFILSLGQIVAGVATHGGIIQTADFRASGFFEKQDMSAFTGNCPFCGPNALLGSYAFSLQEKLNGASMQGQQPPEYYAGAVGKLTANGGLLTGTADYVSGAAGPNAPATVVSGSLSGSYILSGGGQGTATLVINGASQVTISVAMVGVSADRWLVVGSTSGADWTGVLMRQFGSPYTLASCNGASVISSSSGLFGQGSFVQGGLVTCDGQGNFAFSDDENDGGSVTSTSANGAFTAPDLASGRFTIPRNKNPTVGYFMGPNNFFLLTENPSAELSYGEPQTGGPFTNASLAGSFSEGTAPLVGQVVSTASLNSGLIAADGLSTLSLVTDKVNLAAPGFTTGDLPVQSGQTRSIGYSVAANGRVTTIGGSAVGYIVSPSKVIVVDMNSNHMNPTLSILTAVGASADAIPQSGWWWDPKLSGTGFFMEYGGKSIGGMFVAGFLYDENGNNTWLVSTGQMIGSTYTSGWLKVTGGQTLLGAYKAPTSTTAAGGLSIAFSDATHAVMTRPDGTQINLVRFPFTASAMPVAPEAGAPQSGWWWAGPALSGTGYGIEVQGSSVFIVAYVYDDAGDPVWYLALGDLTTPNTYSGTWDLYAGGPQLTSPEGTYSAHKVSTASPMSLTFSDATHGTMTMGSVTIPIARFQEF